MSELPATILFGILIALPACLAIGGVIGLTYFLIRWRFRGAKMTTRILEERFGLINHNKKGIFPDLRGNIEGIDVTVDVSYERYMPTSPGSRGRIRPWTRIRAELPVTTPVQVFARQLKHGETIEWPTRLTGNATFDEIYELFIPEEADLETVLPITVRAALLAANPPIHIANNVAFWTQVKFVTDEALLINAVLSCARVAAAFQPQN